MESKSRLVAVSALEYVFLEVVLMRARSGLPHDEACGAMRQLGADVASRYTESSHVEKDDFPSRTLDGVVAFLTAPEWAFFFTKTSHEAPELRVVRLTLHESQFLDPVAQIGPDDPAADTLGLYLAFLTGVIQGVCTALDVPVHVSNERRAKRFVFTLSLQNRQDARLN